MLFFLLELLEFMNLIVEIYIFQTSSPFFLFTVLTNLFSCFMGCIFFINFLNVYYEFAMKFDCTRYLEIIHIEKMLLVHLLNFLPHRNIVSTD